jgi:hypothetical protein
VPRPRCIYAGQARLSQGKIPYQGANYFTRKRENKLKRRKDAHKSSCQGKAQEAYIPKIEYLWLLKIIY